MIYSSLTINIYLFNGVVKYIIALNSTISRSAKDDRIVFLSCALGGRGMPIEAPQQLFVDQKRLVVQLLCDATLPC